jgi:hypothetical protein
LALLIAGQFEQLFVAEIELETRSRMIREKNYIQAGP